MPILLIAVAITVGGRGVAALASQEDVNERSPSHLHRILLVFQYASHRELGASGLAEEGADQQRRASEPDESKSSALLVAGWLRGAK